MTLTQNDSINERHCHHYTLRQLLQAEKTLSVDIFSSWMCVSYKEEWTPVNLLSCSR